jgi:hypothetical protein
MGYQSDAGYDREKVNSEFTSRGHIADTNVVTELSQETDDHWMSADSAEILLERSDFQVRLADSRGRRNKSSLLINRMYSWRGYKRSENNDRSQEVDRITLQACRADTVFGTLTLAFDSKAGLAADALYHSEIEAHRKCGAKVCELTRLAVDPKDGSKEVLGALFHLAYIYGGLLRGVTDVFIEVNPRHVSFYRRMLDFEQVGEQKMCERVDAPAVLLHLEVAYVAEQIARYGGHRGRGKRSLYPYFFSKQEEEGLVGRIVLPAR